MTVAVRRPLLAGLLALIAVLAGGGLWAARVQIDGAVVATGRLEAAGNRQAVQHPEGGKVAALLVREGQEVTAGQVLLRLDDSALQAELDKTEAQLCELHARSLRLIAERDGLPMALPALDAPAPKAGDAARASDRRDPRAPPRAMDVVDGLPLPGDTGARPPGAEAVPAPSHRPAVAQPDAPGPGHPLPSLAGATLSASPGARAVLPLGRDAAPDGAACAPRLTAELQLFEARAHSLRQQDARLAREAMALHERAEGLARQEAALEAQAAVAEAEVARQEQLLAQHLAGSDRLAQLRMNAAEVAVRRAALALEQREARRQAREAELARAQLQAARAEEATTALHDLAPTAIELGARRGELQRRLAALALRAPAPGRVWGLQVHGAGAVLPAAAPALFVIPRDEAPLVVAYVPALARDLLHPGQSARVHLPGIDGRRSPELAAELAAISADTFDAGDSAGVYRLELHLQPGEAERLGPAHRLQPGMPVEAFLSTGTRTPLRWLVEPLTAYFRAALRES